MRCVLNTPWPWVVQAVDTVMSLMAFHKHLKLPPYKLTKRCGAEVEVQSIHRSCSSPCVQAQESPVELGVTEEICSAECLVPFREYDAEPHSFSESTEHELQSKASVAGWNKLEKAIDFNSY